MLFAKGIEDDPVTTAGFDVARAATAWLHSTTPWIQLTTPDGAEAEATTASPADGDADATTAGGSADDAQTASARYNRAVGVFASRVSARIRKRRL